MRAVTIRQPWAELIVRGEKDVENRSWRTRHRGPLLIHAGAQTHRKSFAKHGVPDDADRSAIIGIVEVSTASRNGPAPGTTRGAGAGTSPTRARGGARTAPPCAGGVWVAGHYGPQGAWHPGHWRCPGVVEERIVVRP